MSTVQVRPVAATGRSQVGRTAEFAVEAAGRTIASVVVGRARRVLGPAPSDPRPTNAGGYPTPNSTAWTAAASSHAAEDRWRDLHPAVRTISQVRCAPDCDLSFAEVLEAVGTHLAADGVRRLDVRLTASDTRAATLVGDRWVQGTIQGDVVASLAVAYPWATPVPTDGWLHALLAPLPPRLQRTVRRAASVHLRQVPELLRSATTEVRVSARQRYVPGGARSLPVTGAPVGSHPFAASRYRTVRAALSFVPEALRSTPFIDIGCGDGRVLGEALASGFAQAIGRELDPQLARRAADAVGDRGRVEVGDALAVPLPDAAEVVFLNNPFDDGVLARFSDLIAATLRRNPRPLLVLYLNPRPIEPLLGSGLLLVHVDPRFSILASRVTP